MSLAELLLRHTNTRDEVKKKELAISYLFFTLYSQLPHNRKKKNNQEMLVQPRKKGLH